MFFLGEIQSDKSSFSVLCSVLENFKAKLCLICVIMQLEEDREGEETREGR